MHAYMHACGLQGFRCGWGEAQEEQPVAALIVLSQHLEGARFQAFWQAADACKDVVGSVPGYYDAVRSYILTVITSTCQKACRAMVAESLRLDGPQLEALVRRPCQLSGGDISGGEL